MNKRVVLSIAGSDPSCGAGVQADLKAFTSLELHGVTVLTSVTVQNTKKVEKIHKLPVDIVEQQIDIIMDDFKINTIKTGMLFDVEIVQCVVKKINEYNFKTVVDPVLKATSGDSLSSASYIDIIKKELINKAYLVTPNIFEGSSLTGKKITDLDDVKNACRDIYELGAKHVLIKGGHLKGNLAIDVLFNGDNYTIFSLPKIPDKKVHGSGCTFSALITGFLALGETLENSVGKAKNVIWEMISSGYIHGKSSYILNFSYNKRDVPPYPLNDNYFYYWISLKKAIDRLLTFLPIEYIPEVGSNFGYALPNAKIRKNICSINGRIIKTKEGAIRCGDVLFGASCHIPSIILSVMNFNDKIKSALNIKYKEGYIEKFRKNGFKIGSFDREHEPENVSSSMEWGTKEAISQLGFVPDLIYDIGCIGKEPMIRILGKTPEDVVKKVFMMLNKN